MGSKWITALLSVPCFSILFGGVGEREADD
jgi:hypothetical protein